MTARVPFAGATIHQVCALVLSTEPKPPSTFRSEIPRGLDDVILRCLMKDPAKRYGSVAELTAALAPYATAGTGLQPAPGGGSAPDEPQALVAPSLADTVAARSTPRTVDMTRSGPAGTQPGPVGSFGTVGGTTALVAPLPKRSMRPLAFGAALVVTLGVGVSVVRWQGNSAPPQALESSASPALASSSPPAPASSAVSMAPTSAPPTVTVADLPDAGSAAVSSRPPLLRPPRGPKPAVEQKPKPSVQPQHTMD